MHVQLHFVIRYYEAVRLSSAAVHSGFGERCLRTQVLGKFGRSLSVGRYSPFSGTRHSADSISYKDQYEDQLVCPACAWKRKEHPKYRVEESRVGRDLVHGSIDGPQEEILEVYINA